MAGRPAPRSSRVGNVSHKTRAPVASAIRAAAASPGPRVASPPIRIIVGSPDRSTLATEPSSVPAPDHVVVAGLTGSAPSDQEASAGRISVEVCGPDLLARMGSAGAG